MTTFILALAVRWWGFPAQARAMCGDEAQLLIEAHRFIQGVYTTPFIVDHLSLPALYEYVLSFPLRLAGSVDVTVARGVSGVLGALAAVTIGVLGIQRNWDFANAPVTRQAFYNGAHEWALFIGPRGAIPVTVVGPYGWPVEYPTLYAPAASICDGRWANTWNQCPTAQIVIFDHDPLDAQRYAAVAHVPVHAGQSDDAIVRYWYAAGQRLPDPARVIAGLR